MKDKDTIKKVLNLIKPYSFFVALSRLQIFCDSRFFARIKGKSPCMAYDHLMLTAEILPFIQKAPMG